MSKTIFKPNKTRIFSDYFDFNNPTHEIIKAKKGDWEKGFNQLAEVSVRIDRNYRALGFVEGDTVFYFRL
jgi:hypothetical protein